MKLFNSGKNGRSILHVLAENNACEILSTIVRVCSHIEGFDLSSLCVHRGKNLPLPVETALFA